MHRLDEKTADYEAQAVEAREAISRSKRVCDEVRFYTKGEVYRLQGETAHSDPVFTSMC